MDEFEFQQRLASSGVSVNQASVKAKLFVEARNALRAPAVTSDDLHYCFVPGRIEFLGKHTDYAGGRSLLCTVERGIGVVAMPRVDRQVRIRAATTGETVECELDPAIVPPP